MQRLTDDEVRALMWPEEIRGMATAGDIASFRRRLEREGLPRPKQVRVECETEKKVIWNPPPNPVYTYKPNSDTDSAAQPAPQPDGERILHECPICKEEMVFFDGTRRQLGTHEFSPNAKREEYTFKTQCRNCNTCLQIVTRETVGLHFGPNGYYLTKQPHSA